MLFRKAGRSEVKEEIAHKGFTHLDITCRLNLKTSRWTTPRKRCLPSSRRHGSSTPTHWKQTYVLHNMPCLRSAHVCVWERVKMIVCAPPITRCWELHLVMVQHSGRWPYNPASVSCTLNGPNTMTHLWSYSIARGKLPIKQAPFVKRCKRNKNTKTQKCLNERNVWNKGRKTAQAGT